MWESGHYNHHTSKRKVQRCTSVTLVLWRMRQGDGSSEVSLDYLVGLCLASLPSPKFCIQRREGRDRRGQTLSYCPAELHLQDKKPSIHKLSYAAVLTLTKETTLTFLPSWNTMDAHLSWVYTGGRLLHRLTFAHVWWGPLLPSSQWNGGRKRNPLVSPASWQCYIHSERSQHVRVLGISCIKPYKKTYSMHHWELRKVLVSFFP